MSRLTETFDLSLLTKTSYMISGCGQQLPHRINVFQTLAIAVFTKVDLFIWSTLKDIADDTEQMRNKLFDLNINIRT